METLYFENIKYNDLIINNNQTVKILKDNIDFYIHLNLKENNEQLIIFSNGAIDPNKSKPPVFMRHSWHEDFNASCIFIDDRTVHNNNLRIGWGVGSEDRHYLMDYSDIAQMIANTLSIQPENTYYYGSSAGGFMSMYLATLHKDTKAIVNNPQCYVDKYDLYFLTIQQKKSRRNMLLGYLLLVCLDKKTMFQKSIMYKIGYAHQI